MNILKWTIKAISAEFLTILLITLFSYFYSYSGIHVANTSGATDYVWESGQRKAGMEEGISYLHMDGNGYNNHSALGNSDVDYLLMGSSHMEAVNVAQTKNTGYLLNQLLPGNTYNIGISGHTIYRCVKNLDAAVEEYHPINIIIETDRVDIDVNEVRQVIDGEMGVIPSYDSGVLYYLQKYVPGVKVLYNQVSDWMSQDSGAVKMEEEEKPRDTNTVLDAFLSKAASSLDAGQHLLIVYQPETQIYHTGSYISTVGECDAFREACTAHGIDFLDLSEPFETLYNEEHILAHGFINTAVGEGHMNEAGHRVFAEEVAEYIKAEWEEQ